MIGPDELKCYIDFDDSWIQVENHWEYDRWFEFSWEIGSNFLVELSNITYTIGDLANTVNSISSTIRPESRSGKFCKHISELNSNELRCLHNYGSVRVSITAYNKDTKKYILSNAATYTYDLGLPPKEITSAFIEKKSSQKFICNWNRAEEAIPDSGETTGTGVAGYAIELFHRPKESRQFTLVRGIGLRKDANNQYKIISIGQGVPEIAEGIDTFVSQAADSMVYVPGQDTTNVYFNPQELVSTFKSQDFFKFTVYPYIVYGSYKEVCEHEEHSYYEILPGTLLANQGTSSEENKPAGLVRVKTADGWKEGQVWVKTAGGWKEASGVYTKTDKGWKESI